MTTEEGGESRRIPEERAADVFRRAARLQSAAAQRLEERVRDAPSAVTPASQELRPADLEAIGREVGIDPVFIRMALAETGAAPRGRFVRWGARWLLRAPVDNLLMAARVVSASPASVLAAMRRILPVHPHRLVLVDTVGDPLRGGALVFQCPEWAPGSSPLAYHASGVEARRLTFLLRELPGDAATSSARTEIQVSADLGPGVRTGVAVASILAACLGTGGGLTAGVLAAAALGPFAVAAGAAGLLAGALLGGRGYGAIHRHSERRLREEVDGLLGTIAADLATAGSFSPQPAELPLPSDPASWLGS